MEIYSAHNDADLFAFLKQGDKNAFVEIFKRYYYLLVVYAEKKLQGSEEAEDVVQKVYANLWERHQAINIETSLPSYLYKAVRYEILNIFSHRKIEDRYLQSLETYAKNFDEQADYRIREKEIFEIINKQINLLPTKMREVFLLSRRENLSHREIAEVLGTTEENVSRHITRALKILRTKLGLLLYLYMLFRF